MLIESILHPASRTRRLIPDSVIWRVRKGRSPEPAAKTAPTHDEIRRQLDRIAANAAFETSQRNRNFLRYVVDETLLGRAERIKAYSVATVVFQRDADFDPQTDPIVRIEASRLRRALDHYYLAAGRTDPVRIVIPKGSYVPVFEYAPAAAETMSAARPRTAGRIASLLAPPYRAAIIVCATVALLGLAGTYAIYGFSPDRTEGNDHAVGRSRGVSLAVRPFEVASPASERDRSLGDSIAQSVGDALIRFPEIFVFAPPQGSNSPESTDYVVTARGEVGDSGMRISVALSDPRKRRILWSGQFEATTSGGMVKGMDQLAGRVARAIAGPRGPIMADQAQKMDSVPVDEATPYQCLVRYDIAWRRPDPAQIAGARACLQRAVRIDPGNASAHAALASATVDRARFREVGRSEWPAVLKTALASAQRAIELAPQNPRAYDALQNIKWLQSDVEQSLVAGERALALNPNDPELAAALGFRYGLRADWEKAIPLIERAFADDPNLPSLYRQMTALHYYVVGRYEEALAEANRIDLPHYVYGHALRAIAYAKTGQAESAKNSLQRILALEPNFAAEAVDDLRARNVHPSLIQAIVEGLKAAGLDVADHAGG